MRLHVLGLLVAATVLLASPARADVRVTIANGNVTVSAKDATVRQILTEWARVGQARIINVERISGAPLTLELTNVPEAQALDTLLRAVSGYLAAPRADVVPNASRYDRIFILATSTGTPARPVAATSPAPFTAPPPFTPPQQDDQNGGDEVPQRGPVPPNAPARGPVFNTFPQPPVPQQRDDTPQQPAPQSFTTPTAPAGVSTPGMVVPAPPQPGQPGQVQGRGSNVR